MRLEIENPTPLHAADLQFQAFADFGSSKALHRARTRTLILTGDKDQLIPPQNSKVLADLIPGVRIVFLRGRGHRALWEASGECAALIADFLEKREQLERNESKGGARPRFHPG
jgi:3-oxoadipate enol-lactonase